MAAASYTTTLIDISLAQATTNFTAIGGGGAITAETDFYIQNGICISKATAATWDASGTARGGVLFNNGAGITVPTDGAVLTWIYWWGPGVLATKANGGAEINYGNSTTAYYGQYVSGSDDWAFGGWRCYPVDPNLTPRDRTVGAPTGTWQYFGWTANVAAVDSIGKGNPYGIDAIRYGRCNIVLSGGDVGNGYATFLGAADWDNTATRRLGLLVPRDGAYYQQGLFQMGLSSGAVDFRDANRAIFVMNTEKVSSNFNKFEVRNASSRVDWTSITISALGTTAKGNFEAVDDADINFDACTFTDMGTFIFKSTSTIASSTFRRCAQITANSAAFTNCLITSYSGAVDTSALVWNTAVDTDGLLDGTTFTKGVSATHALELGTSSPTTITLTDVTFTNYNAANNQTDSAIHVKRTTGTVTINIIGGNTPSYKSDGATVNVVSGVVTVSVTVVDSTATPISGARVLVETSNGTGPFPYQDSVSITRSGSTATTTLSGHGLSTNDKVVIRGSNQIEYNGIQQITVVDVNTFTYTVTGTPTTPATGTIVASFVAVEGATNASGIVTTSRTYPSNQPVSGKVRKNSASPYYRTANITGTVDTSNGFSPIVQLISDE